MAADSDGLGSAGGGGGGSCGVVVTCEGDLRDPRFPARLRRLLRELRALLAEPHPHTLKVNKVEPWNSVRVTLSVPRAAAARLRALAAAGAPQLRALGILSVQLDGDAAVSLRLQHGAELRINTDPDDASTSRSQPNSELLAGLGGIGRILAEPDGAGSSSAEPPAPPATPDSFKSPNTVCPMDGKIPHNIPTHTAADRCEFPFGSMTQARVIHRKENTLGLSGPPPNIRPQADGPFARPSTSTFPGPPPPYPAPTAPPPASPAPPGPPAAPPTVAMSSPLLVNLLQNDAPAPSPRPKPTQHPAKLDRLEDGQVELAVGRPPFAEYRSPRTPAPPPQSVRSPMGPTLPAPPSPAPRASPRPMPFVRRPTPPQRPAPPSPQPYRVQQQMSPSSPSPVRGLPSNYVGFPAPPPPPYRTTLARPLRPPPLHAPHAHPQQQHPQHPQHPRVTPEDLQALLPPTTASMDQKTQSSFQEFQRYQQQYIARQRAASRASSQPDWNEPYRDLALLDLPDSDLEHLMPTLGDDLNLDESAFSAISELDASAKLDMLLSGNNANNNTPDSVLQDITGDHYTSNYEQPRHDVPSKSDAYDGQEFMPPPPVPHSKFRRQDSETEHQNTPTTSQHTPPVQHTATTVHTPNAVHSPTTTQHTPTTTQHLPTTTQHMATTIQHTSTTTQNMSTTTQHMPTTTQHMSSTTQQKSSTTQHMSSTTQHVSSTTQNIATTTQHMVNAVHHIPNAVQHTQHMQHTMNAVQHMPNAIQHHPNAVQHTQSLAQHMQNATQHHNATQHQNATQHHNAMQHHNATQHHTATLHQNATQTMHNAMQHHNLAQHMHNAAPAFKSPPSSASQAMPPPLKLPIRATTSVATATVGSQASAQEIEEQSKQYLIKTLMRDDDVIPPPKEQEKKVEEVTVANCEVKEPIVEAAPEMFGIAKVTTDEDTRRADEELRMRNKLAKKERDDKLAQKGGKPRTVGAKEKPATLKDKIVRDNKSTKVALPRPAPLKLPAPPIDAPKSPQTEKESIKLRLKLDKNEPAVQTVYKADISFVNQQKGDKPTDGELRVPPLHISLRGRNSAVIKNSKKEKKKFAPGDLHTKKIKIRKSSESSDDKSHRRDSNERIEESIASKSSESTENKTDEEYLNAKGIKLNNHYEADGVKTEITGDNNVVYRMKTISKNAHIVTKSHDYNKLNNKVPSIDLKMKKKLKILSDSSKTSSEKERDKEWRNDTLDKEGKYAQNEGYREPNNHEAKKKLPTTKTEVKCDSVEGKTVQSDVVSDVNQVNQCKGASECERLQCHKDLEWTLSGDAPESQLYVAAESRRVADDDNKLKRTIAESAITSPNGLLASDKKRKVSHSSCTEPPGSTNVGTIPTSRAESPPASPRRKERPKDKSYCKLVAERAARPEDKFGSRSPASQAQGEDSGIESMDALSEKSPNQASQSPPARKERLDMPRSTSPASVQRIIGVVEAPPASDELLERLSRAGAPRYEPAPPDIDDLGDIEAELAKMHADHVNGDVTPHAHDAPGPARPPTPILRDQPDPPDPAQAPPAPIVSSPVSAASPEPHRDKVKLGDFDPPPSRVSPPLYTYSNQEKLGPVDDVKEERPERTENGDASAERPDPDDKREPKLERLPLKADFPDKSLLEQLLIEIPTPDYAGKRPSSPSPSALERVARSSVRTRSSSKLSSPADQPRGPRLSPAGAKLERADSHADKTSPRAAVAPARAALPAKRRRRESESSGASTLSADDDARPKKKPRRDTPRAPAPPTPAPPARRKDSDSDSDEPLICKVRGKGGKPARPPRGKPQEGVGTRRSVRHGPPPAPGPGPAPPGPQAAAPVRRKTRSAVGEGAGTAPGVRRRRASKDK